VSELEVGLALRELEPGLGVFGIIQAGGFPGLGVFGIIHGGGFPGTFNKGGLVLTDEVYDPISLHSGLALEPQQGV
jgi:hypothetical protein